MPAHKHAHLMALYAQGALETDKPYARWEIKKEGGWAGLVAHPAWSGYHEYRRKPKMILIGGCRSARACQGASMSW